MILVDTNVILDLVENDPVWADWSQQQLEAASLQATLCINSVIYPNEGKKASAFGPEMNCRPWAH